MVKAEKKETKREMAFAINYSAREFIEALTQAALREMETVLTSDHGRWRPNDEVAYFAVMPRGVDDFNEVCM